MQVPYDEGVANRIGPEPCAGAREGTGEALAGECIGQPLSRESVLSRVPTLCSGGRQHVRARQRERPDGPAWSQNLACADAPCPGTGRSRVRPLGYSRRSASGRRGAVADDERAREVRPRHSSWEADEQSGRDRSGAGGAKGGGQGERERAKHAPDTGSGARVTGARSRTASRKAKEEGEVHSAAPPRQRRLLREAFFALKRDAAPGVDGVTWQTYEADLDRNLTDLHARVQRGAYRALPSRRTYIPKADGRQRPLAVAALEDKIVQRATVAVLNSIYEEEFLGFSYGFRPGRGQHDALDALCVGITTKRVNYIFDGDVLLFRRS